MAFRKSIRWTSGVALAALLPIVPGLSAQEVVQSLPPAGSTELSMALQRLAQNGNDVSALLDAGEAALKLGDVAAAIGFFGRAEEIDPQNSRLSLGLARAYTLSRRPIEALRLFAQAERAGIAPQRMAAERALAFDLVGDAASAQELYRVALQAGAGATVRRNLALSQAISGDKVGFEATLLPLLQQGDNAAFRTRAFGLAILGETEAAVKIARDMMPGRAAAQIEPYLRYMTQLTPAQQAAAGALGIFPRTAAIGRDDAQIAAYDPASSNAASGADAALAPRGPALGSQPVQTAPEGRQSRRDRRAAERQASRSARANTPARTNELPAVQSADQLPPVSRDPVTQPVELGQQPAEVAAARPASTPQVQEIPVRPDLEEAFAGFDLAGTGRTTPQAGAVDITAIEVPRESDRPAPPAHPARHWVQLATGRDISALGFDWRRITRNSGGELAGKNGFTAPWGEANRLLAGPYDSASEARDVVNRLKAFGVDSFPFSSAAGEEIFALSGARAAPAGPPPPPAHPSRHWVQVATGRDRDALGFDWRRIARGAEGELAGKGPFVVRWGEANRLLAGPYESQQAARNAMNRLKALGIDSFTFTSEDGEAIDQLD